MNRLVKSFREIFRKGFKDDKNGVPKAIAKAQKHAKA